MYNRLPSKPRLTIGPPCRNDIATVSIIARSSSRLRLSMRNLAITPPERRASLMVNAFVRRFARYCMKGDLDLVAVPGETPPATPAKGQVRYD